MAETGATQTSIAEPADIARHLDAAWRRLLVLLRTSEYQVLLAIVVVAALLRFAYLDLIPFGERQAAELSRALPLAESFRLPLTGGPSALGVPNPPWASYLYAIPLLLARDPRLAAGAAVLLHLVALLACYATVRRHYGQRTAVLATALLAVNPWATVHARSLSAGSWLLPCEVLLLHGLCSAILARRPWGWTAAIVGLGLMLGISHNAALLVPGMLLLVLVYRKRVRWSYLLLGVCLALLVLSPYLYYLNETRAADCRSLADLLRATRSETSPLQVLTLASELHSSAHLATLAGSSSTAFAPGPALLRLLDGLGQAIFLLALLALAAMVIVAWGLWRRGEDPARYLLLIAWLWVPLLLLVALNPRWLTQETLFVLYPAGFVAMGAALDKALALPDGSVTQRRWWAPLAQAPIWLVLIALLGWQAYSLLYLDVFVGRHDTTNGYGTPYRFYRRTAALAAREAAASDSAQIWVIEGSDAAAELALGTTIGYLVGPDLSSLSVGSADTPAMLLPADRPAVYLLSDAPPLEEAMLRRISSAERGVVHGPESAPGVSVEVAGAVPAADLLSLIAQPGLWMLRGGPLLLGFDWPADARAGATANIATYWTFGEIASRQRALTHDLVLQIVASDGTTQTIVRPFGLSADDWEQGQVLVVWTEVQLPATPGTCTLAAGLRAGDGTYNAYVDSLGEVRSNLAVLGQVLVQP